MSTPNERQPLNGLALCAGIGGLDLGVHIAAPSYKPVCYVERDPDCYRYLPGAPIWDDLATFDGSAWRGAVDLVSAGFPCQPFSRAARGRHVHPDLWPEVARIIEETCAPFVFLENVKVHDAALADLADLGYAVAHTIVPAAAVGAPHKRRRWFALGIHPNSNSQSALRLNAKAPRLPEPDEDHPRDWSALVGGLSLADGIPARLLGNAVVPLAAAHAFRTLAARLEKPLTPGPTSP